MPWGQRTPAGVTPTNQRGIHLREMLDELGPTFVKFGQLLSTRPDIVPPDIIQELRALQDDVRPFPFEQVEQVIESELGLSLEQAARIAKERVRALDFIDARELVDEFARSIRHELDYRLEARNAEGFR